MDLRAVREWSEDMSMLGLVAKESQRDDDAAELRRMADGLQACADDPRRAILRLRNEHHVLLARVRELRRAADHIARRKVRE